MACRQAESAEVASTGAVPKQMHSRPLTQEFKLVPAVLSCTAGAGAGSDSWDSSTIVSSVCEDVGRLSMALQHVEAGQLLAENPELKGVHSTASVRSMLSRMEVA
jgi:hypothetical protein